MPDLVAPAASPLLEWYDRHRRIMPWRALPGEAANPYWVWLSEVMLQQTTVAAVRSYFLRFLARFPSIELLAAAPTDAVMEVWAGLGYYARARNLHACAKAVVSLGGFPQTLTQLRELPGIGQYTAAAIGSIAFGIPVVPVDGNVERVVARLFAINQPLPAAKSAIAQAAVRLGSDPAAMARPADYTQALFDLGATICTPRNPVCALCPWFGACKAQAEGAPEKLPVKAARRQRPVRYGAVFWLEDATGSILLRRRPPAGLLGGMLELPGTTWKDGVLPMPEAISLAPQKAAWVMLGQAVHAFTHFELRLDVYAAQTPHISADGLLHATTALDRIALPSAMQRCVALGLQFHQAGSLRVKSFPP